MREAKDNLGMYGKKTILFVDEIHRFNKGQQDYLLPYVEDGTLILIGATTENPFFEVNGALLSRSRIFELKPLEKEDVKELIRRAVCDEKRGNGQLRGPRSRMRRRIFWRMPPAGMPGPLKRGGAGRPHHGPGADGEDLH